MGPAISQVLPFAIGIGISPIPIAAVIVVLFSARAKANGAAYLLAWIVALAVVVTAAYVIADVAGVGVDATASDSTSTIHIVLGAVLLFAGVRRWRHRLPEGAEPQAPAWMARAEGIGAGRAAVIGAAMAAVNPKNLILALGAAGALAQVHPTGGEAAVAIAVFVVIASAIVTVVVAYRWIGGERSHERLDDVKAWLVLHNDAVLAAIFLVFGVLLVAEGTGRL